MDTRNWEYKGLQLSNRDTLYNFQLTEAKHIAEYNSSIYENKIANGGFSTSTTMGVRVFTFSGKFYGTYEEKNLAFAKLKEIIKTEDFPSIVNRGFYPLKWTDERGIDVETIAKVYKPLEVERDGNLINFTFTLVSEDPIYYAQATKTVTGGIGVLGGNVLTHVLPNTLLSGTNKITVNNEGDRKTGFYIEVVGNLDNPRITNITTGQSLKIEKSTTALKVDNRTVPFTITDAGANAKQFKNGAFVYIVPGINELLVSCENYQSEDQADVTIVYRNAYE